MTTSPRMEAAKRGEKTFTGNPCRKCGGTVRYTAAGNCKVCAKESTKAFQKKIRDLLNGG